MIYYYKIQESVVVGKYTKRPRFDVVESEEDWPVGSLYIEGVFSNTVMTDDEISSFREVAYSDIHTGSSKYFEEAAAKRAEGDEDGAIEAETLGLARRAEIQAEYPFND